MNTRITARELHDQISERLELRWIAGSKGEGRVLESGDHLSRRPSLAGYLNTIYPNKVQILGTEELAYLDGLDPRHRWEALAKITASRPLAPASQIPTPATMLTTLKTAGASAGRR